MRRNFVVRHKKTAASSQAMMRLPKYVAVVVASLLTVVALTAFRSRDGSLGRGGVTCSGNNVDLTSRATRTSAVDSAKLS